MENTYLTAPKKENQWDWVAVSAENKPVASILYDGELLDNELQFIETLYIDLEAVYSTMLAEDGLNKRDDLRYDEIRKDLNPFLQKWLEWGRFGEAPYYLLNQE